MLAFAPGETPPADQDPGGPVTEYRLEQLALAGGTTVRNIRAYRDRGLLPPPRREGRIALYSDAHLGRLRLIADLLDRGYTLQSIGELLAAWERGKDIGDVLGLEEVLASPWSDEEPATMTQSALDEAMGAPLDDDDLQAALDIGMVERVQEPHTLDDGNDDETFLVRSPSQIDAGAKLVAEGVPVKAVLASARRAHEHIDHVAHDFVALFTKYVVEPWGDNPTTDDLAPLGNSVERLRPVAAAVVSAELSRAMARHTQAAVEAWLGRAAGDSAT